MVVHVDDSGLIIQQPSCMQLYHFDLAPEYAGTSIDESMMVMDYLVPREREIACGRIHDSAECLS